MRRVLVVAALLAVGASAGLAQASGELERLIGGPIAVDSAVEPEVQAAFLRAVTAIPESHRQVLRELSVRRASAPELPDGAPLVYRIWASATLAMYRNGPHEIVVFDAALRPGKPEIAPATRAEVYGLVLALGDALAAPLPARAEDPALERSWADLAGRIARLAGRPAYDPVPPLGDAGVLADLVRGGQEHMLGGRLELWQLLVHEIGHAVQLRGGDVECWASLSGWTEADGGAADGFVGGMFANERPSVAMRVAFGAGRGPLAHYWPGPGACFPTPYASFDPYEDFAECYRFLVLDPATLARNAPAKFLAVNALGWSRTASRTEPGPLHVAPETLAEAPWADPVSAGARALILGESVDPLTAMAVLRAHAEALVPRASELPVHPALPWPSDLPLELSLGLTPEAFEARVGDVVLRPPAGRVREVLCRVAQLQMDDLEFAEGLERLTMVVDRKREEPPRTPLDHLVLRALSAGDLLREGRRDAGLAELQDAVRAVAGLEKPGQRIVAWRALVNSCAGLWEDAAPQVLAGLRAEADPFVRASELAGWARQAGALGKPDQAQSAAAEITGPFTVGAEFRMMVLLEVAEARFAAGEREAAAEARAQAWAAASSAPVTEARDRILERLARQATGAGDLDLARNASRKIDGTERRAEAIGEVALALAGAGRVDDARAHLDEAWVGRGDRDVLARRRARMGDLAPARERARMAVDAARGAAALADPDEARHRLETALGLLGALSAGPERAVLLEAAARAAVECGCAEELARPAEAALDADARSEFARAIEDARR